jgi:glutamate---cysteine ligase / carboxylate-amine ligase
MLLDRDSFALVPRIDAVLADTAGGARADEVKSELMQSMVEVATPICASPAEIDGQLRRLRASVSELAAGNGCRFASAGTHPFARFEQQAITDSARYRAMVEEFQYIARRQLICGLHLHTAVDDPEKAIRVVDGLLVHLPEFLALSASSPFWRGRPTGLRSCRQMIVSALPRSGMPPRFESYAEYAEVVAALERGGSISDYTQIWWDVRPHPRLGTVELRVCDAVSDVEHAVALAAYFQATVKMLCEAADAGGRPLTSFHRILTTENKWLAARHGLAAELIDLEGGGAGRVPLAELVRRSLRTLEPHARELGSERELDSVHEILVGGNGADSQLRVWDESRDIVEVVRELARRSEAGARVAPGRRDRERSPA